MLALDTLTLIADLRDRDRRSETARALAQHLGGDDLIIFMIDRHVHALLPAPGFRQTLENGASWQALIEQARTHGLATGHIGSDARQRERPATAISGADDSVLVLLGTTSPAPMIEHIRALLPLIVAALEGEQAAAAAAGEVAAAREDARSATRLAIALDEARSDLQQALRTVDAAQARLAFLAEASSILTSSLDLEETLRRFAELMVPYLSDGCAIVTFEDDGHTGYLNVAAVDASLKAALHERASDLIADPARPPSESGDSGTVASSRLVSYPGSLGDRWPAGSMIQASIMCRHRQIGALVLVRHESSTPYSTGDLPFVDELVRRLAAAVDNARLYQEAREAVRARDEFLSVAAHELRTPITSLRGFAEMLIRRVDREGAVDADRLRRALQTIDEQSAKLTTLVTQLLDTARIQGHRLVLEPSWTDIAAVTRHVAMMMQTIAPAHHIEVIGPASLNAWVDPLRLEQVLANLIDNAIKYSPDGGRILVEIHQREDGIALAVEDDGIGIGADEIQRIFDPFHRPGASRRIAGLGLGLFIAQEIVALHGGHIDIESELGKGSRFTVSLPSTPKPATNDQQ